MLRIDVGDGQIEVVGLENSIHVAQITAGMQSGRRLAQCSNVVIRYSRLQTTGAYRHGQGEGALSPSAGWKTERQSHLTAARTHI